MLTLDFSIRPRGGGGWGWGGGGVNLWVIVVRMCEPVFRNLPHSYSQGLWQNRPIHILPFYFLYPFIYTFRCLQIKKYNCVLQIKRHLSTYNLVYWHAFTLTQLSNPVIPSGLIYPYHLDDSILWKVGPFIYQSRKVGSVKYLLLKKKGANHVPDYVEKGGHSSRTYLLCPISYRVVSVLSRFGPVVSACVVSACVVSAWFFHNPFKLSMIS